MAALNVIEQHIMDPARDGTYLVVSRAVRSAAASDTVTLPEAPLVATDLTASNAATVTVSGTTATITGGLAGAQLYILSRHIGNGAAI